MKNIIKNIKGPKGRKADVTFMTTIAILAVITILIFGYFVYNYYTNLKSKLEAGNCRDSISAHALVAGLTAGDMYTNIKCPTRYVTVKTNNDMLAKRAVAEEMQRCWWEWGKGQLRLFKGDGVFCHICTIYTFDKPKIIPKMFYFLANESIRDLFDGDTIQARAGVSYQDYLEGYNTPNAKDLLKNLDYPKIAGSDYINTTYQYSAVFVYESGKKFIGKTLEGSKAAVGTTGSLMFFGGVTAAGAGTAGLIGSLGTAAAAGALNAWNPVGWAILIGVGTVATTWGIVTVVTSIASASSEPGWKSYVVLRPYNESELKDLGCQRLETDQESHSLRNVNK